MIHKLTFNYDMSLETDEYNPVKEVIIRCNSVDPEEVLEAFTEFCACVNIQMQGQIVDPEDDDEEIVH